MVGEIDTPAVAAKCLSAYHECGAGALCPQFGEHRGRAQHTTVAVLGVEARPIKMEVLTLRLVNDRGRFALSCRPILQVDE